jgi:hypothetical protein
VRFQKVRAALMGSMPASGHQADSLPNTVHQPMMDSTEGHREFVTRLAPERARLREAKMMRVRGLAAAYEARLLGDIAQVRLVAEPAKLGDRKDGFVDAVWQIIRDPFCLGAGVGTSNRRHSKLPIDLSPGISSKNE